MSHNNDQQVIEHLTEQWHLTEPQYLCLLQLESEATTELLKLDTTLHQLFAASPLLADLWMTSQNRGLGGDSPMDVIMKKRMAGLRQVVQFLCLEE